jgi:hypothetical protein
METLQENPAALGLDPEIARASARVGHQNSELMASVW